MGSPVNGWVTVYQIRPAVSFQGCTRYQGTGISSATRPVWGSRTIQSYPFPPSSRLFSSTSLRTLGVIASLGRTFSRWSRGCPGRSRLFESKI